MNPLQPPYPAKYNLSAYCDFHSGSQGHSIDQCERLQIAVQDLVMSGRLSFLKTNQQNVGANPLPNHGTGQVNVVGVHEYVKRDISGVTTPIEMVYKALVKASMIRSGQFEGDACPFHGKASGCNLQYCSEFRSSVQKMMDEDQVQFYVEGEETQVGVLIEEQTKIVPFVPKPPTIPPPQPFVPTPPTILPPQMLTTTPRPFHCTSNHQVPWKYSTQPTTASMETGSANITGVGGMTRSGRCYNRPTVEEAQKGKRTTSEESIIIPT